MKTFTSMQIVGDELQIFAANGEAAEELEFSVDLTPFYWKKGKGLEENVFSSGADWLFGGASSNEVNGEFMENFCCDVPCCVVDKLTESNIEIKVPADKDDAESYFITLFNAAIRKALNLDDDWRKIED